MKKSLFVVVCIYNNILDGKKQCYFLMNMSNFGKYFRAYFTILCH